MVGEIRTGLLSFKEMCLVTPSASCILQSVQHSGYDYWNILITLYNFYNLYIPLPGSRVALFCYSFFPRLGLCWGDRLTIVVVNCCSTIVVNCFLVLYVLYLKFRFKDS
jgi:hypothetical protein